MSDCVKLVFKLDKNKTCYILKKVKARNAEKIVVPKIYEGKYVVGIDTGAFKKCGALKTLVLPESVVQIADGAFCGTALGEIEYLGTVEEWENTACRALDYCVIRCADGTCGVRYNPADYGTGEKSLTEKVVYALNADGKSYSAVGVRDEYKYEDKIVLAQKLGGKPMTAVASKAFTHVHLLESVGLPEGIRIIGDEAFCGLLSLKSIELPRSLTIIGHRAFYGCSLSSITIPDGVRFIGENAFEDNTYLINVTVAGSVDVISRSAFDFCGRMRTAQLGEGVKEIAELAFHLCEKLYKIVLPKSLKKIGALAFEACEQLKLIEYGGTVGEWKRVDKGNGWDSQTPEYVVNCADGAVDKSGAPVKTVKPEAVKPNIIADGAYKDRKDITEFFVPDGVTEIGDLAFSGCVNLSRVRLPDSLFEIGECAFEYGGLQEISIPADVGLIDYDAFSECRDLSRISVAEGNARYYVSGGCLIDRQERAIIAAVKNAVIPTDADIDKIFDGAFSQRDIKNLIVPDNIKEICDHSFRNCGELTEVRLSRSVLSIEDFAFENCEALTAVYIEPTLKYLAFGVFEDCEALKDIYYNGTKAEFYDMEKDDNWHGGTSLTVHCGDGDIEI